jgi:hypothetical protein
MNEAQQAALLPTMPDKDLKKLIKRLAAQVSDLENSISSYQINITVAGAQKELDWNKAMNPHYNLTITAEELALRNQQRYGKTNQTRMAKLITKTRRLQAALNEEERRPSRHRDAAFGAAQENN